MACLLRFDGYDAGWNNIKHMFSIFFRVCSLYFSYVLYIVLAYVLNIF